MSDERQAFEQLHAIPSGAEWCEKRHIYIHRNYSGLVLHPINESLEAFCEGALWQASRQAVSVPDAWCVVTNDDQIQYTSMVDKNLGLPIEQSHDYAWQQCNEVIQEWIELGLDAASKYVIRPIALLATPTKADDRISVHEYTARISLEALKFYTEWMQRNDCGDPEPIEHFYAMQAIEEIESLLPDPPKQEQGHE
jgi:hypothetical protein